MRTPPLQRLLARIAIGDSGCWEWRGSTDRQGYGRISVPGRRGALVHRVSYVELVGPIPVGLDLDHLCRNRGCCNPDHLEPVTRQENLRRSPIVRFNSGKAAKTECLRGHPFDEDNTYMQPDGSRGCRACRRQQASAYRARLLARSR